MKLFALTAAAVFAAHTAFAGNLVFEAPEPAPVVVEEEPMGGSNAGIVVPILAVALIAIGIAVSND